MKRIYDKEFNEIAERLKITILERAVKSIIGNISLDGIEVVKKHEGFPNNSEAINYPDLFFYRKPFVVLKEKFPDHLLICFFRFDKWVLIPDPELLKGTVEKELKRMGIEASSLEDPICDFCQLKYYEYIRDDAHSFRFWQEEYKEKINNFVKKRLFG